LFSQFSGFHYLFVSFFTFNFLNCRSISTQLPDEVKGIYSEEKYQRSQEYKRANCRFELVTASLQVVILLGLFMGGGFALIDGLVRGRVQC
jgi:STE24 endopeptidase